MPDDAARRTASALRAAGAEASRPYRPRGARHRTRRSSDRSGRRTGSPTPRCVVPRTPEEAIERLVRDHVALGAVGGFVTGVGGYVTLPVALPVNLAEFYVVATRMVGAIAIVRGYDVRQPEVRTAVLLTLVASRSDEVLAKEGIGAGKLPRIGLRRMPPGALMLVNKAIFFRLLRRVNERLFSRLGRGVPFLGGGIGAVLDSLDDGAHRRAGPGGVPASGRACSVNMVSPGLVAGDVARSISHARPHRGRTHLTLVAGRPTMPWTGRRRPGRTFTMIGDPVRVFTAVAVRHAAEVTGKPRRPEGVVSCAHLPGIPPHRRGTRHLLARLRRLRHRRLRRSFLQPNAGGGAGPASRSASATPVSPSRSGSPS